jgi:hypothetical protein
MAPRCPGVSVVNLTWIATPSSRVTGFCIFHLSRTPIAAKILLAWSVAAHRTGFGTILSPVIHNVTSVPRTTPVKKRITHMHFICLSSQCGLKGVSRFPVGTSRRSQRNEGYEPKA